MTTRTMQSPRAERSPFTIGFLAWTLMAGAALQLVLGIPLAPLQNHDPGLWQIAALNALSHVLLFAGIIGVVNSRAAGRSLFAGAGLALSLLGLADWVVAEAVWATAGEDVAVLVHSTGTLALMVGLILAGIAVVRTEQWRGWQRYTLLATGLYILLVLLPAFALPGYAPNVAIGVWGVCWLLVGLALRQSPATAEGRAAAPRLAGPQHPRSAKEGSLS